MVSQKHLNRLGFTLQKDWVQVNNFFSYRRFTKDLGGGITAIIDEQIKNDKRNFVFDLNTNNRFIEISGIKEVMEIVLIYQKLIQEDENKLD